MNSVVYSELSRSVWGDRVKKLFHSQDTETVSHKMHTHKTKKYATRYKYWQDHEPVCALKTNKKCSDWSVVLRRDAHGTP